MLFNLWWARYIQFPRQLPSIPTMDYSRPEAPQRSGNPKESSKNSDNRLAPTLTRFYSIFVMRRPPKEGKIRIIQQLMWVSVNKRQHRKGCVWKVKNNIDGHSLFSRSLHATLLDQITNNNSSTTTSEKKPVSNEDRRTHTSEHHVETESTKHNADKVSCSLNATVERSRQEESQTQSADNESENYRVLVETESWRTAKNWKSDSKSSSIRADQGNYRSLLSRSSIFNVLHSTCSVLFNVSRAVQEPVSGTIFFAPTLMWVTKCCFVTSQRASAMGFDQIWKWESENGVSNSLNWLWASARAENMMQFIVAYKQSSHKKRWLWNLS